MKQLRTDDTQKVLAVCLLCSKAQKIVVSLQVEFRHPVRKLKVEKDDILKQLLFFSRFTAIKHKYYNGVRSQIGLSTCNPRYS